MCIQNAFVVRACMSPVFLNSQHVFANDLVVQVCLVEAS